MKQDSQPLRINLYLVYLCMLLEHTKNKKVKCRVSKSIRLPKVSPKSSYKPIQLTALRFYTKYLYKLDFEKYATVFYLDNDAVYFYNSKNTYVNRTIPIYDYKSRKFNIISLGRRHPGIMWGYWLCVKAPNGNLYAIYAKETKNYRREIVVHNLSKGKVIHKVEYEYDELVTELEVKKYAYILLNSFVVIRKIKNSDFYLYLIDLINETINTFKYNTSDYINNLLEVISSEDEKEYIRGILPKYSLVEPLWDSSRLKHNEDHVISLFNNEVPFVKYLYFVLEIKFYEHYEKIYNALVVSFKYEDNELDVVLSIGEEVAITTGLTSTSRHVVKPPSNVVLFSKKYKLDSSYDISKSHPYYIYKVSKNFVFSTNGVYERTISNKENYTIMKQQPKLQSIYDITVLQTQTDIFVNLEKYQHSQDRGVELYAINDYHVEPQKDTIKVLNLAKIRTMFRKTKDDREYQCSNFVNISHYLITLNVKNKIEHILNKIYENKNNLTPKIRKYYYYIDETNGCLYVSAIVHSDSSGSNNNKVDFYIFECNVRQSSLPCRIVVHSGSYDIEAFYKSYANYSNAVSVFANNPKNKIQFFEIFKHIGYSNRIYIHENEIMLVNDLSIIKVCDIKYNRRSMLTYVPSNIVDKFKYRNKVNFYHIFDYNVISPLTIFTDNDDEDKRFRYAMILCDLQIVSRSPIKH